MDPSKLFERQLNLIGVYGLKLDYEDNFQGISLKFLAIFNIFLNFVTLLGFYFYNVAFESLSIGEFTEALACVVAVTETIVKMAVFLIWHRKFKKVLDKMSEILNSRQSLEVESFNRISRIGGILLTGYFATSTGAAVSFVLKALYKSFVDSRVFPFQGK